MKRREFVLGSTAFALFAGGLARAQAPKGKRAANPFDRAAEVVGESGLSGRELRALLLRIAEETKGRPYLVTRTKQLVAVFAHARLAARADDVFIDWFPDTWLLTGLRGPRVAAFARGRPEFAATGGGTDVLKGDTHGAYHACLDTSHVCPDWESVLALGPTGLAARARERRTTAANDAERLFLDCVAEVYDAMAALARRWADVAAARGAAACAATLREIAAHPPRTLREALQLQFLYDRCQEAEGECVRSQGLFDRLFIRFYRADLAAGRLTRADAKDLVKAAFLKYWIQNHRNNKNIAFGGYGRDGEPVWNELTEIAFEVHDELNHVNPKLTFRYGRRTPREQLLKVCRTIADGRSAVVFFNDDVAREMFVRRGKDAADAADAVLIGCYEPGIQGRELIASMAAWINLAKPLELALNAGCTFDGFRLGPDTPLPTDADGLLKAYLVQLDAVAARACADARVYAAHWTELNPAPLMSGAFRDAVANARDAGAGGLKYNQSGIMCAGLPTVADALAAVRYLVDETKAVTMAGLRDILKADWAGHETLRARARRAAPKWGNNDDRADAFARTVADALARRLNREPNGHGGTFQMGLWSIDNDLVLGRQTAATPDGRKAGEPLARNNSATAGCGTGGPTALILSQTKLDQAEAADGFISDVIMPMSRAENPETPAHLVALLRTYAERGGQCIHFNCFRAATLRDAMAHPERYPDLQVRVCGWNARWVDLSRAEQLHFLATAEAQEGR